MNVNAEILTRVESDWTSENLEVVQMVLRQAYEEAARISRGDRVQPLSTPNAKHVLGTLRWDRVNAHLDHACKSGLLRGINSTWISCSNRGGSVRALELRGLATVLTAHHLQSLEDDPRFSLLRAAHWIENAQNQMLLNFVEVAKPHAETLINLTLVHGNQNLDFAKLRIYCDPQDLQNYIDVSDNLAQGTSMVMPFEQDAEDIQEAAVALRPILAGKAESA